MLYPGFQPPPPYEGTAPPYLPLLPPSDSDLLTVWCLGLMSYLTDSQTAMQGCQFYELYDVGFD